MGFPMTGGVIYWRGWCWTSRALEPTRWVGKDSASLASGEAKAVWGRELNSDDDKWENLKEAYTAGF